MELTDPQFDRLMHYTFLFGLRVVSDAYEIEAQPNDPRFIEIFSLLRDIAEGEIAIPLPRDIHAPEDPRLQGESMERDRMSDDRMIAAAILRDRDRVFREMGEEPPAI